MTLVRDSSILVARSEEVRLKLNRDNDLFLMGPTGYGFGLSLVLKPRTFDRLENRKYIAALRILVGSTSSNSVPRKVLIQGRSLECTPATKKWYCHILTSQEVALAVRNGFLSIFVGPSFDCSTSPVIDALEVFAVDREVIDRWHPQRLYSLVSSDYGPYREQQNNAAKTQAMEEDATMACLDAFMRFCQIIRPEHQLSSVDRQLLERIIMRHALDNRQNVLETVGEILACFSMSQDARTAFQDKAVLLGCRDFLAQCVVQLSKSSYGSEPLWQTMHTRLCACFKAASSVAKSRPINYYRSVTEMSPAVQASKFLPECFEKYSSNDDLIVDFVELCLLEMAVATSSRLDTSQRSRLGGFDGIRKLMLSKNRNVIASLCRAVAEFCADHEHPSNSDNVLFAGSKLCYICDCCGEFLMKGMCYSLPDETRPFDLCAVCYKKALHFAAAAKYDPSVLVKIDGRHVGDSTKLTCAESQMLQSVAIDADNQGETDEDDRHSHFENFAGGLFDAVADVVATVLDENLTAAAEHILRLAADITRLFRDNDERRERAGRLGKVVACHLSRILRKDPTCMDIDGSRSLAPSITFLLNAVKHMLIIDHGAHGYFLEADTSVDDTAKSSDLPVCDHGSPCVRRKYASGTSKSRAFFACPKEYKFRCNFFAWAGKPESTLEGQRSVFDAVLAGSLWEQLCSASSGSEESPLDTLFAFVIDCTLQSSGSEAHRDHRLGQKVLENTAIHMTDNDIADGLLASQCRLYDVCISNTSMICLQDDLWRRSKSSDEVDEVVEVATALMAMMARSGGDAIEKWRRLACELILSKPSFVRLAKRALSMLCDRNRSLYVAVRVRYTFNFQCERLIVAAGEVLQAGLFLLERSRQAGNLRKATDKPISWQDIRAGDMLLLGELVTEDIVTIRLRGTILTILSDILSIAKKHEDHWREFCEQPSIEGAIVPQSTSQLSSDLRNLPPTALILLTACVTGNDVHAKALRLLEIALETTETEKSTRSSGTLAPPTARIPSLPVINLSAGDAYAFGMKFVAYSSDSELRKLAVRILTKISRSNRNISTSLFSRLLHQVLPKAMELGKNGVEILSLLQGLVSEAGVEVDVATSARYIQACWKQQMLALRYDRARQSFIMVEMRTSSSSSKKRYELSPCLHCTNVRRRANTTLPLRESQRPQALWKHHQPLLRMGRLLQNLGFPNKLSRILADAWKAGEALL